MTKKQTKEKLIGKMLTLDQALTVRNNIIGNVRNTFLAGGVTMQQFELEFEANTVAMAEDIVLSAQRDLMQQGTVDDVIEENKKPVAKKKVVKKKD